MKGVELQAIGPDRHAEVPAREQVAIVHGVVLAEEYALKPAAALRDVKWKAGVDEGGDAGHVVRKGPAGPCARRDEGLIKVSPQSTRSVISILPSQSSPGGELA